MSLRLRLALLFALGTALVVAAAGVAFVLQLRASLDASLDPGLRAQVAAVGEDLGQGTSGRALPNFGVIDGIVQLRTLQGGLLDASPQIGPAPLLTPDQQQRAVAGEVSFTATVAGDRSRVLATTVPYRGDRLLVIVGTGTDVSDAAVADVRTALLLGGPPAVLVAGVAAWLLGAAALRPVERMRRQAAAISDRDSDGRLAVPRTGDEVAALAVTLNALLGRLQAAVERERGFVADAGHELRTPLAILRTELELAARPGRSREALADAVAQAGQETDRLIRLAEDLLVLARMDGPHQVLRQEPVAVTDLLRAAAARAGAPTAQRHLVVTVDCPPDLTVTGDADRLRQAVDNLLDNAGRHAPAGSSVSLTAVPDGDRWLTLTVADEGPGFPETFLPHAFERFQRAESARSRDGGGAGLGLSIVQAVATAHGGRATAGNRPGGGAWVTLHLPRDGSRRVPADAPAG